VGVCAAFVPPAVAQHEHPAGDPSKLGKVSFPVSWQAPGPADLKAGAAAVEKAKLAGAKTQRERDYIAAIETFYTDADKLDHRTRALAYEKAMDQLQARYPDDHEAAIFHALALVATAPPTDKT